MIKIFDILKSKKKKIGIIKKCPYEPLDIPTYETKNKGGRPKALTDENIIQLMKWKAENISNSEMARRLKVSEATVRNYLKIWNQPLEKTIKHS